MLWGGVFSKEPKKKLLEFNSSDNIVVDEKLVKYDIIGSMAHVKMLKKQKLLKAKEADEIIKALEQLLGEWETGKFKLNPALEDVHMNVEVAVSKKTPHGKKMHTARSRNDQVNLDMRLYLRDEIQEIVLQLKKMQTALKKQGKSIVAIPGHTHTRVAQPISNKLWGDAYAVSFEKDIQRLKQLHGRVNKNPLGACAIAGTTWNIDRKYTAKLLGFDGVEESELETISSRGELEAEFAFICSLIAMKLSRISEDLIWLSYVGLVEIPEEYCTGSSIMPNKMNPDVLELVRGRTGKVYGNLFNLLTVLKGTPTGHNADTQETKKAAMDSAVTIIACLDISSVIIAQLKWDKKKGEELIRKGYGRATLLADKLAKKRMPFRAAHEKVGKIVKELQKKGKSLEEAGY
ncbi:MAG: argininosuccinate lyase [Candidatus Micrarchaeota archaeon]